MKTNTINFFKYFIIAICLITMASCASTKKSTSCEKNKHGVSTPRFVKNNYLYSKEYQRKLKKSVIKLSANFHY